LWRTETFFKHAKSFKVNRISGASVTAISLNSPTEEKHFFNGKPKICECIELVEQSQQTQRKQASKQTETPNPRTPRDENVGSP
jgi:hypothetical protein